MADGGAKVGVDELPATIGVIGAGTMGTGIAQVGALSGLSVVVMDIDEARVAKGRAAVTGALEKLVKKEKLSAADRDAALGRLRGTTDYSALGECDFIIEAATEDEPLKLKILRQMDAIAKNDAILATNTRRSRSPSSARRSSGRRACRPAFLQPGAAWRSWGCAAADRRCDRRAAVALAKRLGKTPVVVKDSPGFVVNRLLCPMLNEAVLAYGEGIASARTSTRR